MNSICKKCGAMERIAPTDRNDFVGGYCRKCDKDRPPSFQPRPIISPQHQNQPFAHRGFAPISRNRL